MHIDAYHNAMPLVPVETLADGDARRMVSENVHHLQLALLDDDVQCVRIQLHPGRRFYVVVHEQSVRQTGAELE